MILVRRFLSLSSFSSILVVVLVAATASTRTTAQEAAAGGGVMIADDENLTKQKKKKQTEATKEDDHGNLRAVAQQQHHHVLSSTSTSTQQEKKEGDIEHDSLVLQQQRLLLSNLETKCGNEIYELSAIIDTHIYLLASPVTTISLYQNNNPSFKHSCGDNKLMFNDKGGRKHVDFIKLGEEVIREKQQHQDTTTTRINNIVKDSSGNRRRKTPTKMMDPLPLGEFELRHILEAYRMAQVMDGTLRDWDIVTNNCATFALSFVNHLGIEPKEDGYIVDYVVKSLALASQAFEEEEDPTTTTAPSTKTNVNVDRLMNSPSLGEILVDGIAKEEYDDSLLLHLLVTNYIKNH